MGSDETVVQKNEPTEAQAVTVISTVRVQAIFVMRKIRVRNEFE